MSNKELTKDESFALITDMIGQAKRNVAKGGSFHFLLWGWVVMLANIGHYLITIYDWYDHPYIVWVLTIPAAIASIIYGARKNSQAGAKSHLDRLYGMIWLAVFIGVMITIFMGQTNENMNAVILTFAGIGTFISGVALRFNPLIMGAIALWIASLVAYNFSPIDQYPIAAIGILAGYLVPGYLLRKVEK